jgi:hypothetical protein
MNHLKLGPGLREQFKDPEFLAFFKTPEDIMLLARHNPKRAQYLYFQWLTSSNTLFTQK